jgi:hypothetical protein
MKEGVEEAAANGKCRRRVAGSRSGAETVVELVVGLVVGLVVETLMSLAPSGRGPPGCPP